jgi:hypothetical protein
LAMWRHISVASLSPFFDVGRTDTLSRLS